MNYIPEIYKKKVLILGCGNILFGDDGFGPEVCKYIKENYEIPEHVEVQDCGTGVREILFNIILSSQKPSEIVIIDAMDLKRSRGEIFFVEIENLPKVKIDDFSLHSLPTSNLLEELRDECGVNITILSCQVGYIPKEVQPGLSEEVKEAVPKASAILAQRYFCKV